MPIWKIILLITGIFAFLVALVSFVWTWVKKNKLIKKYNFEHQSQNYDEWINLKSQVTELESDLWLVESLELVINKIRETNSKTNLFVEKDGLVACLSQKNIQNSTNTVFDSWLDQNSLTKNIEKLQIKNLKYASNFETFFDFILISAEINPKNFLEFLEKVKIGGHLVWKYKKNQRRAILKMLKLHKIHFDEFFYYNFLIIQKK
ncbi:hypothetical protein KW512_01740 [Mesomycoplasma ovipneumoniae]|uniref:BC85_0335 family putative methyltransferase n=1 Tax=Mesomycoplasma ovipneumoniae TaxID=29562 RepID=UPI0021618660|nr:hypothetical protein [Mesomycoplasma ovipneumoniae]UVO15572.1 hypothetical protein KW512_01740 [Mesomycoplasma ovipneumoniae]